MTKTYVWRVAYRKYIPEAGGEAQYVVADDVFDVITAITAEPWPDRDGSPMSPDLIEKIGPAIFSERRERNG